MKDKGIIAQASNIRENDEFLVTERIFKNVKVISHFPKNHPDSEANFKEFKRLLNMPFDTTVFTNKK